MLWHCSVEGGQWAVKVAPGAGAVKDNYKLYAWWTTATPLHTVVMLLFTDVDDVEEHWGCLSQMVLHHQLIIFS